MPSERDQRAQFGVVERLAHATNAILVQTPVVDAFLEVHSHRAQGRQMTTPIEPRIDVIGTDFTHLLVHGHLPGRSRMSTLGTVARIA